MSSETDQPKDGSENSNPQDMSADNLIVGENAVTSELDASLPEDLKHLSESEENPNNVNMSIVGHGNMVGDGNTQNQQNIAQQIVINGIQDLKKLFKGGLFYQENNPSKSPTRKSQNYQGEDLEEFVKKPKREKRDPKLAKPKVDVNRKVGTPQEWFKGLTENQKLYAMLVVLLKGLDREVLDNLYVVAVEKLRREGLSNWINDARTLALDELLDSLAAIDENGVVQLSQDYEEEVKRQIGNHSHLLWSVFENLLVDNEKEIAVSDREFREAFGHAVGKIGIRYPNKLERLLDKFVENQSNRIVVIGGYALAEIAGVDTGEPKFYDRILDKWVMSKQLDRSWAATASVWRIYLLHYKDKKIKSVLWGHLETLIDNIDDIDSKTKHEMLLLGREKEARQIEKILLNMFWEKVDVISDALNHMFDGDPEDVVSHLVDWLKFDEQNKLSFIGRRAADEILNRISRSEFHTFESVRWGLKLFPAILDFADEELTETVFSTLRAWFTSDIFDQEKKHKITGMVVEIIDQANSDQLDFFRKGFVDYCFTSNVESNDALTTLSINLLTRTYFVDGYSIIPPDLGSLVLFADATPQGKALNSLGLTSRVHPLINSIVKTHVYLMGYKSLVGSPDKIFQEGNQLVWHDLPRLLANSIIESSKNVALKLAWLAALSYGPIINETDILAKYPATYIINLEFYKSKVEDRSDDEYHFASIDCSLEDVQPSNQWLQVVDNISSFLTSNIGQNDPEELWKVASQYVKCKPTVGQVIAQIETAFKKIKEDDISDYHMYYSVSCLFWWLLKKNNVSAVKICIEWLADDRKSNDSFLSLGVCFGKFILRSSLRFDVPAENITELSLSLLRISPDWGAFELVLKNIEKNYRKQLQVDGAEVIDPSLLVSFLPNPLKSKMVLFLNKWIDDKKSLGVLKKFSERLKFFIEMGLLSSSPDIEETKKFGLVFVDGDLSDRQYLKYALEFISEMEKMPLGENVLPVLYRMGQKVPLAVGYGKHNISLIGKDFASPNFLNPILTSYASHKVLFRAILTRNPVFDFDDKKQEWNAVPTVIFDEKRQSKYLDGANLLYITPNDYRSRDAATISDAVGDELSRMVKMHS